MTEHDAKSFEFSTIDLFVTFIIIFIITLIMISSNDFDDNYVSKYALNEFENVNKIMSSFSLNEKYVEFQNFLKIINNYIKQHDYSICISESSTNRININDTIYLRYSKNEKIKFITNKFNTIKKQRNVKFKRTECFFFKSSRNSLTINKHYCASIIKITHTMKTKNRRIQ